MCGRMMLLLLLWIAVESPAQATPVTFDVSGTGSVSIKPVISDTESVATAPFSAGSSITIETDRNGNGSARDWLLVSGTLHLDITVPVGPGFNSIVINSTVTLSGGEATLSGDQLFFSHYALTQVAEAGTFRCTGIGSLCGILGLPDNTDLPIGSIAGFLGVAVDPIYLGIWDLSSDHAGITGSTRAVTHFADPNSSPPPIAGLPSEWFLFGASDNVGQFPIPPQPPYPLDIPDAAEPGASGIVLIVLAGAGYALRRRAYSASQRSA